jgi:hypothetical protein
VPVSDHVDRYSKAPPTRERAPIRREGVGHLVTYTARIFFILKFLHSTGLVVWAVAKQRFFPSCPPPGAVDVAQPFRPGLREELPKAIHLRALGAHFHHFKGLIKAMFPMWGSVRVPHGPISFFGPRSCFIAFVLDIPNGFWPLDRAVGRAYLHEVVASRGAKPRRFPAFKTQNEGGFEAQQQPASPLPWCMVASRPQHGLLIEVS